MKSDGMFTLAEKLFYEGEYEKALDYFQKSNEISLSSECLKYIGRVYLKQGRLNDALKLFEEALVIVPDDDAIYYYMGVVYFKQENYEEAIESYQHSISINGKLADAYNNLGMCYFRLEYYQKAIEEFNNAYFYDNEYIDAIYNKGLALICMSKFDEAIVNLQSVLESNPNDIEAMLDIAHCYYKSGDYHKAKDLVSRILSIEAEHNMAIKLNKKLTRMLSDKTP